MGTDPFKKDTDGESIEDGVEVGIGTDPLDPNDPPVFMDFDEDGVPDLYDPDPSSPDADGDSYLDFYEIALGSNPLDANDVPPLGDINENEQIEFVDSVITFNLFLGNFPAENFVNERYIDLNRDGQVNFLDGVIHINWFLGNFETVPIN